MAIEIREQFQVKAPVDAVWRFMLDPKRVVTCMPGAQLDEVLDERTFLGSVKIRVGAITASYKGRVELSEVDEAAGRVELSAEGREAGGGTARGRMSGCLRALPDGRTEVVTETSVDLTGRIVQVGRGMIQGVARQIFRQFVAQVREQLEAPEGSVSLAPATETQPLRVVPLVVRALLSAIGEFLRRLLRRPRPPKSGL